jgi:nanoRNase/pAp phosphatase (c-di-AMP/oligoRNAs hydrolase)
MPRLLHSRSERLIEAVRPFERVVVLMHDNPDPDAIATGWAIKCLLERKTDKPVRLIGGGEIVRAENCHMVKLLEPPLELVEDFEPDAQTAVVLVDCGPEATHHLLSGETLPPAAVIDHHESRRQRQIPAYDVRPRVAASATIAAMYWREQGLEPGPRLATALLYAIHSETRGSATAHARVDHSALTWLTRRADPTLLAEIQNAPLPRAYYGDLVLALQNTFVYDGAAFCWLPRSHGPEIVGEVADLLVRDETVARVLCATVWNKNVLLSARTDKAGGNARELLRDAIAGLGHGGGHARRAGGKLFATAPGPKLLDELQDELRGRWIRVCGAGSRRGERLIAKREIMKHL